MFTYTNILLSGKQILFLLLSKQLINLRAPGRQKYIFGKSVFYSWLRYLFTEGLINSPLLLLMDIFITLNLTLSFYFTVTLLFTLPKLWEVIKKLLK
jgi:hypothetical protein